MSKPLAFFRLGRPFTSALGSLAVLAACVAGVGIEAWHSLAAILAGMVLAFVFSLASNTLNDYVDRDIDRINHPERPIPSMQVKPGSALSFAAALFAVSGLVAALISVWVGAGAFVLYAAALVIQIGYEYRIKRTKFIGNYLIAILTVMAFLLGGVVVNSVVIAAILASTAFLAILAREIVKDVEDLKGDVDRMSMPKIIGVNRADTLACILLSCAIGISILAFYPLRLLGDVYLGLILLTDAMFVASMPVIFKDSKRARQLLKYAMLFALLSFVVGGLLH